MKRLLILLIWFIRTTVVMEKSTYWVAVPSEVITVGSGTPPPTTVSGVFDESMHSVYNSSTNFSHLLFCRQPYQVQGNNMKKSTRDVGKVKAASVSQVVA